MSEMFTEAGQRFLIEGTILGPLPFELAATSAPAYVQADLQEKLQHLYD